MLHVVDLDGARDGTRANWAVAGEIARGVGEDAAVELGGGIRSVDDVAAALQSGVRFVVVGTLAAERPELLPELARRFAERVVLGLDVKQGRVAVRGWEASAALPAGELAARAAAAGIRRAVYTQVARDGMLGGPDVQGGARLQRDSGLQVTLSGGVGSLDDVREAARAGLHSCIVGRALLDGRFTVGEARSAAAEAPLETSREH
jgi:phosphoribosylformimino-5-aminoimidazole carboxamide ribotide isomerase